MYQATMLCYAMMSALGTLCELFDPSIDMCETDVEYNAYVDEMAQFVRKPMSMLPFGNHAAAGHSADHTEDNLFIFFGAENRSRSLLRANLVTFEVSLDNGAAVTVSLETHSQTRRVTRIIVYAYHPEYLYRHPSTEVGKDYDLALGLTAVLGNVKEFRYGHFERRAEWLAKLGIRGRLPGNNALDHAIRIMVEERRSLTASSLDTLPVNVLRWVIDDRELSNIDEVMKLVPEGMTLVAYIQKRMATKGGNATAEKERAIGYPHMKKMAQIRWANAEKRRAMGLPMYPSLGKAHQVNRANAEKRRAIELPTHPSLEKVPQVNAAKAKRRLEKVPQVDAAKAKKRLEKASQVDAAKAKKRLEKASQVDAAKAKKRLEKAPQVNPANAEKGSAAGLESIRQANRARAFKAAETANGVWYDETFHSSSSRCRKCNNSAASEFEDTSPTLGIFIR